MRRPETLADLDRLQARARTPDQHRGTAARLSAWADELRVEHRVDPDVHLFVGENHELAGELHEARRWLTMRLLRAVLGE